MITFELFLTIYFVIGAIVSIPLARRYVIQFRSSNHSANLVLPKMAKLDFNRLIDSYVFILAWIVLTILYPFKLVEILIRKEGKI